MNYWINKLNYLRFLNGSSPFKKDSCAFYIAAQFVILTLLRYPNLQNEKMWYKVDY